MTPVVPFDPGRAVIRQLERAVEAKTASEKLNLLREKSPEIARLIESILDGALEAFYPKGDP